VKDFRKLIVWEKAHKLTLEIYRVTSSFPREELYGLTGQLRRASVSVPANIAEGCGRDSEGELLRFMRIAMGSSSELEYEVLLAHDLGYLSNEEFKKIHGDLVEVRKMLNAFIRKLKPTSKR
jgi:four helix bundle protein